ncbi:MAG: transcription termination/antitermination protein NusA [Armatimonadetes bacterium]|nr:transcription termination/antitermination protein NusA [Armatimonadota bacterium]
MDIRQQLQQIAQERDMPVDTLVHEIETSLAAAYKKFINLSESEKGAQIQVVVRLDEVKGWTASVGKEVVAFVTNDGFQISLTEARKRKPEVEVGDFIMTEVDPNRFGRIAAQTFKQVLSQQLREAETRQIHDVFSEKMGEVVSGTISRRDAGSVFVQVNKVECELPKREQVPTEYYRQNDRLKVYVFKVDDSTRRLRVIVSRTHPNLLRKLFELEVPEINDGVVVIKSVAREPGQRSKLAVHSTDDRVDPIGACVGPRGVRVQTITDELNGEKIDVVPYSDDPKTFIENALSPAKVNKLTLNEEERSAHVIVPDTQLSLAIGKGGQNVRLAARLTEWKIDIVSESQSISGGK